MLWRNFGVMYTWNAPWVGGRWPEAGRIYSFILRRSLKLRILPNRSDVLLVNMRCTPCAAVSQYKLCSP